MFGWYASNIFLFNIGVQFQRQTHFTFYIGLQSHKKSVIFSSLFLILNRYFYFFRNQVLDSVYLWWNFLQPQNPRACYELHNVTKDAMNNKCFLSQQIISEFLVKMLCSQNTLFIHIMYIFDSRWWIFLIYLV